MQVHRQHKEVKACLEVGTATTTPSVVVDGEKVCKNEGVLAQQNKNGKTDKENWEANSKPIIVLTRNMTTRTMSGTHN